MFSFQKLETFSIWNMGLKCLAGSIFLAFCSQINIPLPLVPMTLQTLGVFLLGLILGHKLAAYSVLLYLIEGCCGMPVFAEFQAGIVTILGFRGGYLIGFVPAAYVVGYMLSKIKNKTFLNTFFIAIIGSIVILTLGYLWLSKLIGFTHAFVNGILPFCLTDIIKATIFALIASKTRIRDY